MSIARFNRLENIEGDVDIDVRDIQITYDALVLKGDYRPNLILRKYQDAFYKDGVLYIAARRTLPISMTGNWEVDKENVRIYATIDHTASFANERTNSAEESAQNAHESEEKADLWANAPHGVEVEPGKYSARHYAEDAVLITGTEDYVRRSRNLSDVNIIAARHNLGIGSAASATLLQELGNSSYDVVSQKTVTDNLNTKVDILPDHGLYPDVDRIKLSGIEEEATKNATDAQLRDRATHTGEQEISTVSGLQAALDNKVETSSLSLVAVSGSYSDLEDLPSIPEEFDLINWLTNASESEINQIKALLGIE